MYVSNANKVALSQQKRKEDGDATSMTSHYNESVAAITTKGRHLRIAEIIFLHQTDVGNRLLWNDDWENKISSRDYAKITLEITNNVESLGGLEIYKALTTENPYALTDPICGTSAQNIFKLMVEDDLPVNPAEMIKKHPSDTGDLDKMAEDKSYVLLVNDGRLGHMFLIDKPAGSNAGYIYQSNLGGSLPALSIADWMKTRSKDPVPVADIKRYLQQDALKINPSQWYTDTANILEINKDPKKIEVTKLKENRAVVFYIQQYNESVFDRNLASFLTQVTNQ
ncbi:cycle-inhibiting factor [Salmonella enterica]|nr:cycle-inhibiting factor [Salmonella enterica]